MPQVQGCTPVCWGSAQLVLQKSIALMETCIYIYICVCVCVCVRARARLYGIFVR